MQPTRTSGVSALPSRRADPTTERVLGHFIAGTLMGNDNLDTLASDEALLGTGILDSLGLLRLVVFIHDELGVDVADELLLPEHFQSLAHLAALVERLQATRDGPL